MNYINYVTDVTNMVQWENLTLKFALQILDARNMNTLGPELFDYLLYVYFVRHVLSSRDEQRECQYLTFREIYFDHCVLGIGLFLHKWCVIKLIIVCIIAFFLYGLSIVLSLECLPLKCFVIHQHFPLSWYFSLSLILYS